MLRPRTFERAEYMRDLVSKNYFKRFGERTYRPVMSLSFFADRALSGANPRGYHIFNIALHALAALFVLLLLHELGLGVFSALVGALIFASHAIQTEPVILASNREELLCGLFFFLSFLLYARGGRASYAVSVAAFLLALFSKEMAAALPLILVAYDIYSAPPEESAFSVFRSRFASYLPYFAGVAAFLILRQTVFNNAEGSADWIGGSPFSTLLTMSFVFFKYLKLLIFPLRQCADYVVPALHSLGNIAALLSVTGLALFIAAAVYFRGRARYAGFAMAFFLLSFLPVSNIIPFGAAMADRYMYIPSFAICLALAALVERLRPGAYRFALAFLIIASLFTLTFIREDVWRSDYSLWGDTAKCAPESAKAYLNLGNAYLRDARPENAIQCYKKVPSRTGYYERDKYYYNLGLALESAGKPEAARRAFESAAGANIRFPEPVIHLAFITADRGDLELGLKYVETAVLEDVER
ncbi:MAG: tetratricopeptide repeat protein, partial [bacterium]